MLSAADTKRGLRLGFYDGMCSVVMGTLTSGVFLTGFALALGATELQIGILAALPPFANLAQLLAAYLLERSGRRKWLCVGGAALSRGLWLLTVALPFAVIGPGKPVWVLSAIIGGSSVFFAMSSTAWQSWMRDLVPGSMRGRYFARRTQLQAAVGIAASLAAGWFIDYWKAEYPRNLTMGFALLFTVGVLFGLLGLLPLGLTPEPPAHLSARQPFWRLLSLPFRDRNFRRLMAYAMAWAFSTALASTFFIVYMLNDIRLDYAQVVIFSFFDQGMNLLSLGLWGRLTDRYGNKPVILFGGLLASTTAFCWIFAAPGHYAIIPIIYLINGFAFAGIGLASGNILLKVSPNEHNAVYISVYSVLVGFAGALAPILGGYLAQSFEGRELWISFSYSDYGRLSVLPVLKLRHFHFLFLLSSLCRFLSNSLLVAVREEGEAPVHELVRASLRTLGTVASARNLVTRLVRKPQRHREALPEQTPKE
ncbi:MAG: MFS transporter [Deinococcus sp.]|nr:MFS transporter [Deinococcus sp.]